jgi:hypothetical protein
MKGRMAYLKDGLTIALIAYLIHSIGWTNILRTISDADLKLFLLSWCLIPIFVLLKTWKWHTMVLFTGATENFSRSLCSILVGLAFRFLKRVLADLGENSLEIYLVHPFVVYSLVPICLGKLLDVEEVKYVSFFAGIGLPMVVKVLTKEASPEFARIVWGR